MLARKAFCSWICPVGAIGEWIGLIGGAIARRLPGGAGRRSPGMISVPGRLDRVMRWARLPVLAAILVATAWSGELVFRAYDPYYVLFGMGGHDVRPWSYALVGAILAAAAILPMAWCRWICPLGAALWPLARGGLLRIARDRAACTGCRTCETVCPHSIAIADVDQVRSGECTLCMECVAACHGPGTLDLRAPGIRGRARAWAVPAVLVALAAMGVAAGSALAIPSFEREFAPAGRGTPVPATVEMQVEGMSCVDTARRAAAQVEGVDGVLRFTAYASRHTAKIEYDPSLTDVGELRRVLEGPVLDASTGQYLFHQYEVVNVDGCTVDR